MDAPDAGQEGAINYRDPPTGTSADEQFVCEVSGTVSAGDCTISSIWVWNAETRTTLTGGALAAAIQSNGKECLDITSDGDWFFDQTSANRIPAFLGDAFADKTNYIAAVALFESSSGCEAPPQGIILGPRAWTATGVEGCPVKAARVTRAARAAEQFVTPSVDGDWLHYAITVTPTANFFRLLDRDGANPLKAAEIAVAAHVHWRPAPDRELVIRDPQGISDCRIRDSVGARPLMRYQGLPKFCLVLWQPSVPRQTVVTSQCRSNPLELSLDPEREVIVALNDNNQSLRDNEGTIELWVKVPALGG